MQETLGLVTGWGEESVPAELRSSRRNADIDAKIAQGTGDKGYTRDTQQSRMKITELKQACQKTREANNTSQGPQEASGNKEEDIVDEEEEEEENAQQGSGGSILPDSQDLFLTLEPIPSQGLLLRDRDGGEGISAATLSMGASSTPAQRLSQIREHTFCDLTRASETDRAQLNAGRLTLSESTRPDQKGRKACREQERNTQEEMLRLMGEQTDMLRHLVEVQERQLDPRSRCTQ
ncbi:hypothetical protein UY3_04672 [Chelonia mydas]|uniref:Uncharacterized protein n=1 Tax=Chelonia mydas TaxID=8469 RepID=M7BLI8_CHEMY|nr:hypothetical protein UY3_04672 [Chelonia mydas]